MRLVWIVGDADWNTLNSGAANAEFLFAKYLLSQPEVDRIDFIDLPFPNPNSHQYPPLLRKLNGVHIHLPRLKIHYKPIFKQISEGLTFKAKLQLAFLKLILWFKFRGIIGLEKFEGKKVSTLTATPLFFSITEKYPSQLQRQYSDYIKKLNPDVITIVIEILAPIAMILKQEDSVPNVIFAIEDWDQQLQNLVPGSLQYSAVNACFSLSKWLGENTEFIDQIYPVSAHIKEFLIRSGYSKLKISEILPSPVDLDLMRQVDRFQARERLNLPIKKRIILTVGRFMERKHYEDLVEILPNLPDDVILYMKTCTSSSDITGYEEQKIFERKIKEKNLRDRVIIDSQALGYHEMCNVYSACDVAVYPFEGEAFGMCASETLACKRPLVVYNSGNFPSFINGNGFLIEPFNLEELTEKVQYLLENPKIAQEMGNKGREIAAKFDIKVVGKQLLDKYCELIK
ncbi:MAG: glycosyltransferase family 4 protein [Promethearchaeota archaeon]